jgi:tRNA pseudouridine13 synthase
VICFNGAMKIKQSPEDFRVEELTAATPGADGPFACYRLSKRGWTTPDALQAVRRRWQIDWRRVSYGGLKDRHADTVQHFTIFHGPKRNLTHHGVRVEYLGQLPAPFTSDDIRANRFRLVLRALSAAESAAAERALEEVRRVGVPNYFDDQRFGSVGPGREFVARHLVAGDFEAALKLALTAPYEFDRAGEKQDKARLRQLWGDWPALKHQLGRGHARSLVDYLVHHPTDFRGAVARLRPELRGLYLAAYQSDLWNRMLARWLAGRLRPEQVVPVRLRRGVVPMYRGLDPAQAAELDDLRLPLPSARGPHDPEAPASALVEEVLAEDGLTRADLRLKGLREMFFSRGDRAAVCRVGGPEHQAGPAERHPGREKLVLGFELPRGCYATLVVKRVLAG